MKYLHLFGPVILCLSLSDKVNGLVHSEQHIHLVSDIFSDFVGFSFVRSGLKMLGAQV